ncbi:Zinc finger protein, partial [Pseudolycoriella hygida]
SVICQNCIIKIDEYDELYMNAMTLEDDLRSILLKTLAKQLEIETSLIDVCDESDESCHEEDDGSKVEDLTEETVLRTTPSKLPSMYCNICHQNFDSFTELRNHEHGLKEELNAKPKEIPVSKTPAYTVTPAGTFINCNNFMIQQRPKPDQMLTLKCSMCNSKFFNKSAIKKHYKESHYNEARCDACGGLYSNKEKLKEHRERHAKITNPLQCVECDKVFKARNPLTRHMATHTLEKFFVCELCGKQFTHHSSFKMHMMAHDDVREKKCEECGQLFRSSSHLNRHKRVHTNEKPYECIICHRSFAQRYNMMSHFKSHCKDSSTVLSHVCTVCDNHFSDAIKLKEHYDVAHCVVDSIESCSS